MGHTEPKACAIYGYRLDHKQIIKSVNRKISDGKVFKLIKQFLKAGGSCGI
jgi:hypothetical protein